MKIKKDGQEIEITVNEPSVLVRANADAYKSKVFWKLIQDKIPNRAIAAKYTRDGSEDERKAELDKIGQDLRVIEFKLRKGGVPLWGEARNLALEAKRLRNRESELYSEMTSLDNQTADAQAETAYINFLLSECVFHNGRKYYKDVNDVLSRGREEGSNEIAIEAMKVFYNWKPEEITDNFENKFLVDNGLAKVVEKDDRKYLLMLDKQGRFVDDEGRLIDDEGRFINEKGEFIDRWGNSVDKDGNLVVKESLPFT